MRTHGKERMRGAQAIHGFTWGQGDGPTLMHGRHPSLRLLWQACQDHF